MIYHCCDENRRAAVAAHPTLNGIDWLEVLDRDAPEGLPRQRSLLLRLLKPAPAGLGVENLRIEGGERVRRIGIDSVEVAAASAHPEFSGLPDAERILVIQTDRSGDYSRYRLRLVQGPDSETPPEGFDPRLAGIEFEFKIDCLGDFDCRPRDPCPEPSQTWPDIDYLARDYASLRRMLLDRLARHMPGWRDRSPADLATTLAELIAYVGDLQHYQLDAIGTEAYLRTARRRSSLRRHALLVDYRLGEGCNARAWLHLEVEGDDPVPLPEDLRCYTRLPGMPKRLDPDSATEREALTKEPLVFEPLQGQKELELRADHNRFDFYSWGDTRCCLPRGSTRATLAGHWPELAAGDVLILQEVLGPRTGQAEDADPTHRQAVRLTAVQAFDGGAVRTDPLTEEPITEIQWHADDALTFPLCLSAQTDPEHGDRPIDNVSIALGNNILVDHGRTIEDEALGSVPEPRLHYPAAVGDGCQTAAREPLPPRFHPGLAEGPVTRQGTVLRSVMVDGQRRSERVLFDPDAAATAAMQWSVADALPAVRLDDGAESFDWRPRHDLLDSHADDRHFVLETEDDGSAAIRFGDDHNGRRPDWGTAFRARYRVGNGMAGNVGAGAIAHAATKEPRILSVTNPLPAQGGTDPESAAAVRRHAPQAFRRQERAVTPADYAEVTERMAGVQRAVARLRWTGSWHTVVVTVDRVGGAPVDAGFAARVVDHLERYRMTGHDLRIEGPVMVPLEIDLLVCVDPGYFRSDVRRSLYDVLGSRQHPDGTRGLFHPDNFSFGQTVYLGPLYAAARGVPGVTSVQVTRFQRQGRPDPAPLQQGYLTLDSLEIARLDNDPNFPEHGVLRLELHGGK